MKIYRLFLSILLIYLVGSCNKKTNLAPSTPTTVPTSIIVSTNTPPIPTATPGPWILFQQDFESGVPGGITVWNKWNVVLDDTGNHIFCNEPADNWPGATYGHDTWDDYAIQLRVKFLDLKPDQSVSVDVRKNSNSSEKYSGELHYGGEELNFSSPHEFLYLGYKEINIESNTWYTLLVEASGNYFKYYINGELIGRNTDDHRQQGFGGFSVSPQTSACFDDIRVWALSRRDVAFVQAPTPLPTTDIPLAARLDSHKFPKLFIQNQEGSPSDDFMRKASYWDLIILDVEAVITQPDYLGPSGWIRESNPNAVIMTYFSAADILPDDLNYIRTKFISKFNQEWYMHDVHGNIYHLFPVGSGDSRWTQMFNLSTEANTFMPNFLNSNVMNTGLVDGIFYDWINESFAWLRTRSDNPPNSRIDINLDGQSDSEIELNTTWSQGTIEMLKESRKVFPPGTLIVGNGGGNGSLWVDPYAKSDDLYKDLLNGRMLEGFLSNSGVNWQDSMRAAVLMDQAALEPRIPLFTVYGVDNDFDLLRYTLASALMFDGYFAMTTEPTWFDSPPLKATWWYDEYSVDFVSGQAIQSQDAKGYLGYPLTDAYNFNKRDELLLGLLLANDPTASRQVWRRDFQNGIVLVNPSGITKTLDLKGQYRKILGTRDPKFNDGSIVEKIVLLPHSGIILLNIP